MVRLFSFVHFHWISLWHIQMRGQIKTHTRTDKTRVFGCPCSSVFCLSVFVRVLSVCVRSVQVLSVCVRSVQVLSVCVRPSFVYPSPSVFVYLSSSVCPSLSVSSVQVCPCVCFCLPSHLNMPQVKRVELNEEEKTDHFFNFKEGKNEGKKTIRPLFAYRVEKWVRGLNRTITESRPAPTSSLHTTT